MKEKGFLFGVKTVPQYSDDSGHPCLIPNLGEKAFSLNHYI